MVESGSTLTGILVGRWSPNYISILKKYQQLTWQFAVRHPFGGNKRIYIQGDDDTAVATINKVTPRSPC